MPRNDAEREVNRIDKEVEHGLYPRGRHKTLLGRTFHARGGQRERWASWTHILARSLRQSSPNYGVDATHRLGAAASRALSDPTPVTPHDDPAGFASPTTLQQLRVSEASREPWRQQDSVQNLITSNRSHTPTLSLCLER